MKAIGLIDPNGKFQSKNENPIEKTPPHKNNGKIQSN